jgi:hypothetical protein
MSHTSYQQLAAGPTSQPPLFLPHPLRPSTSHLDHSSSRPPSFLSHSMSPAELPERAGSSGQHTGPRGGRARRHLLPARSRGAAAAVGMAFSAHQPLADRVGLPPSPSPACRLLPPFASVGVLDRQPTTGSTRSR